MDQHFEEEAILVNTATRPDAGLAEVLIARARAASDGRLVGDVVVGMFVAIGFAVWHPSLWLIPFGAAATLAAFGAWGIADRELAERSKQAPTRAVAALEALRAISAIAGGVGALLAFFGGLAMALGTWIS